jgi:hypothetical protein
MKSIKYSFLLALFCAGLSSLANAHLTAAQQFTTPHPIGNGTDEATYLNQNGYTDDCCQFLTKYDVGSGFSGNNFDQYFTVSLSANGTSATVSWDLTGSGFTLCGVLLKDGSEAGSHGDQLYRFYGVSADETVSGSGTVVFDNPVKGISHISFFGCEGQSVPDSGTTAMLLGSALTGLGVMRRYLKR